MKRIFLQTALLLTVLCAGACSEELTETSKGETPLALTASQTETRADIGKASCSIAGSGDISIKGSVDRLEKSVAGSGTVSVSR